MSDKIKTLDSEMVIARVHELMAEGKASSAKTWTLVKIVDTIEEEFGTEHSTMAFQYIVDNYKVL
jgi:hypothetical protein